MSLIPNPAVAQKVKLSQHKRMQNIPGNKFILLRHFIFYSSQTSGKGNIAALIEMHLHTLHKLPVQYGQENYT